MKSTIAIATFVAGFLAVTLTQTARAAQPPDLIAAVKSGDIGSVKRNLQSPQQVNARDARGNTALHWAALASNERIVAQLLEAGSDARATNNAGATPLHYGVGNERVVSLLLKASANPNARSVNCARAQQTGKQSGCVAYLINSSGSRDVAE